MFAMLGASGVLVKGSSRPLDGDCHLQHFSSFDSLFIIHIATLCILTAYLYMYPLVVDSSKLTPCHPLTPYYSLAN